MPNVRIVVARYQEDVAPWVNKLVTKGYDVIVYDKGQSQLQSESFHSKCTIVRCENVGREAETWLRHITDNYDELADLTIFLQGSPYDHANIAPNDIDALVSTIDKTVNDLNDFNSEAIACVPFGNMPLLHEPRGQYGLNSVEPYHAEIVKDMDCIPFALQNHEKWFFSPGAQYAVSRKAIHRTSLEMWRRWHKRVVACKKTHWSECGDVYSVDEIDAWTLERLWMYLF